MGIESLPFRNPAIGFGPQIGFDLEIVRLVLDPEVFGNHLEDARKDRELGDPGILNLVLGEIRDSVERCAGDARRAASCGR
jgi:hypothetical protein